MLYEVITRHDAGSGSFCTLSGNAMIDPRITSYNVCYTKLLRNAVSDYPEAMKAFCQKHNYPFIDMYQISQKLISQLGDESSKKFHNYLKPNENPNYPNGVTDDTHFSPYGAKMYAFV